MREWIQLVESDLVHFPEYPPEVAQHVERFITQLEERGYEPHVGGTRVAMISPDRRHVVKIPLCDQGMTANNREQAHFSRRNSGDEIIPLAACRLFFADREIGVPMLMMRYVKPINRNRKLPPWVGMVDCQQVGHDHTGRLVAYDL